MKMSLSQKRSRLFARQCKAHERDNLRISHMPAQYERKGKYTYGNLTLSQEGYLVKQVQSGWEETECR